MTSLLDGTKIKYVPTAHTYPLVIKKNQTMVDNNLSKKKRDSGGGVGKLHTNNQPS